MMSTVAKRIDTISNSDFGFAALRIHLESRIQNPGSRLMPEDAQSTPTSPAKKNNWVRIPLYIRILVGVALGTVVGLFLRADAKPLGEGGKLVVTLLKTLATPLIFFAVIDAFLRTQISAKNGLRLILLSTLNAVVAVIIGFGVAHVLQGGKQWQGQMDTLTAEARKTKKDDPGASDAKPTLDPLKNVSSFIPQNIIEPFQKNSVITVVLLGILGGGALRKLKNRGSPETVPGLQAIEQVIFVTMNVFTVMLEWIVQIIPIAVFGVVAGVIGEKGVDVFRLVGIFLATILIGLFIHAVIYYSLLLWIAGRVSPRIFFASGLDAILTALSCGSSLVTLPVTLRCLDKMKVAPGPARLAACIGTNLNHDGIILYEAAATLFMAQAFGIELTLWKQLVVAAAAVMAGIGIAGVPEAGLITLMLVLEAAGLPREVSDLIPLLFTVDWIIGRCRAATNVISDMTVATILNRYETAAEPVLSPPFEASRPSIVPLPATESKRP
jgi:Na+/H+-dicarboxylate symporter